MPLLSGMLCLRGAAVPSLAEEWQAFNGDGAPAVEPDGFVHTGIPCAVSGASMAAVTCLRDPARARHGALALDIEELDALYSGFPDLLDAAAFTIADPIMGERIFAAIVPSPGESVTEIEFREYLEDLEVAPFKVPEKLVVVSQIPRGEDGRIARERILEQI
jgi:mycobactin salicyl-AMP ligase